MINPIRKLKEENDWTIGDLATAAGIGMSAAWQNLEGVVVEVNDNILNLFEELGYDAEEVTRQYEEFREARKKALLNKYQ